MTVTTLTYIRAHEHIDDLFREAEASRRAGKVLGTHRVRRSLSRVLARRAAPAVELEPTVIGAHRVVQAQHGH